MPPKIAPKAKNSLQDDPDQQWREQKLEYMRLVRKVQVRLRRQKHISNVEMELKRLRQQKRMDRVRELEQELGRIDELGQDKGE